MREYDLVILSTGQRRAVMRVLGSYFFVPEAQHPPADGFQHQREAELVNVDPNELWDRAGRMAAGYSPRWTLIRCARELPDGTT